jgi:ferredoxin
LRIISDKNVCIGSGQCVLVAPELFDQDEADGSVITRAEQPPADSLDEAREAVALCPSGALSFVEDE